MRLTYTHWKFGRVTRDVEPVRGGLANHYHDRGRVYLVTLFSQDVYNAGDMFKGHVRIKTPVHIGYNGAVI